MRNFVEPWKYLLEMSESLIKWERRGGEFAFYAECKCKKFGLYFSVRTKKKKNRLKLVFQPIIA